MVCLLMNPRSEACSLKSIGLMSLTLNCSLTINTDYSVEWPDGSKARRKPVVNRQLSRGANHSRKATILKDATRSWISAGMRTDQKGAIPS